MDQNLFEAVQTGAWVFLFVFALSFALIQYNHIDSVIDTFIDANMFGSRGDSTSVYLDESEIDRKAQRAEIIMAILNIPDTALQTGNANYSVTINDDYKFSYYENISGRGVQFYDGINPMGTYIIQGTASNIDNLVNEIKTYLDSPNEEYDIEYSEDGIKYES